MDTNRQELLHVSGCVGAVRVQGHSPTFWFPVWSNFLGGFLSIFISVYSCPFVVLMNGYDSDVEGVAEHGEDAVRGDDPGDASDDGRGGGLADGGGVGAALHSAETAGQRDNHAKEPAFGNTEEK